MMQYELYRPVTDPREIEDLLAEVPLAIDRERFLSFALGFPRKYLFNTPRVEIVKHFVLFEGFKGTGLVSSLSRQEREWKLSLMTAKRTFLFSRIVGCLSCFGANIRSAEAFANSGGMVLDTFLFQDTERRFDQEHERSRFQRFLEEVVEGTVDLNDRIRERWEQVRLPGDVRLEVQFDDDSHESATRLQLRSSDHFGLLYLISQVIATEGCSIEVASIETVGGEVIDDFFITYERGKVPRFKQHILEERLSNLSRHLIETAASPGDSLSLSDG